MSKDQTNALPAASPLPKFHIKNSSGAWQLRPFDPNLSDLAKREADELIAAGEQVIMIDADPAPILRATAKKVFG